MAEVSITGAVYAQLRSNRGHLAPMGSVRLAALAWLAIFWPQICEESSQARHLTRQVRDAVAEVQGSGQKVSSLRAPLSR